MESKLCHTRHRDSMKSSIVHIIAVVHQFLTKMIIDVGSIKRLRLFSTDDSQTDIQSEKNLQREVFVKPCKKFDFEERKILKLKNRPKWFG